MNRVLLLLWLVSSPCLSIRVNASAKDYLSAQAEGFNLNILNNSSLPLNILALPKALRMYAASSNNLQPGKSFDLVAVMGAYDFDVTIHDGENGYNNYGETGWGLLKDGTTIIVASAAGAGLTGTLAVSSAAVVTAALTSWAIAPAFIVAGTVSTFLGVAVMSSMAVSTLTDASMDFAAKRFENLLEHHSDDIKAKQQQLENDSSDFEFQDKAMFKFNDVVEETAVREAFIATFPHLNLDNVLMDKVTAQSYFKAMQSQFSDWKVAKGSTRRFAIAGGFMNPVSIDLDNDSVSLSGALQRSSDFTQVSFAPLALGEIDSSYGCNLPTKGTYWEDHAKKCEEACVEDLVSKNATSAISKPWYKGGGAKDILMWPEEEQLKKASCVEACQSRFTQALEAERQVAASEDELQALKGQQLFAVGMLEQLLGASRAAGISTQNDGLRTVALKTKATGVVTQVDIGKGAARLTVDLQSAGKSASEKVWFPFESLSATPDGAAIYAPKQRVAPAHRYGECWSKCGATDGAKRVWDTIVSGLKQVVTVGGVGKWCLASDTIEKTELDISLGGRVCSSHDHCANVRDDEEWHCTDSCS